MPNIAEALDTATTFTVRRPRAAAVVAVLGLVLSALAMARLRLETDVTDLITTPSARTFKGASKAFGLNEQAVLLVESAAAGQQDRLVRYGRALRERLTGNELIARVEFELPVQPETFLGKLVLPHGALYFSGDDGLAELETLLTPAGMRAQLDKQSSRLGLLGLGPAEEWIARDPLELGRAAIARVRSLEGSYRMALGSPYFLSEDGRALLIVITGSPAATGMTGASRVVGAIDAASRAVLAEPWATGLTVSATGGYHFSEENERVIRGDLGGSVFSSVILCALIVAFGLRVWRPAAITLLTLPTLWGTILGFGLFATFMPHCSIMVLGCAAVMVGLGIDYSTHVASASYDLRSTGLDPVSAVESAVRQTRRGLVGSALNSMAVYLAYLASEAQFLGQIGLLTALGLFTCGLAALVLLPPMLVWLLQREAGARLPPRSLGAGFTSSLAIRRPWTVVVLSALIALIATVLLVVSPPRLEDDLRNVQVRGSRVLATQERLATVFGGSREPVLLLLDGRDEAEVVAACHRLEAPLARLVSEGTLVSRTSIAALVPPPDEQARVLALLARHEPARVRADLAQALEAAGFDAASFASYVDGVSKAVAVREPLGLERLRALGFADLTARFVARGEEGVHGLVLLFPKVDLWEPGARRTVVAKLEAAVAEAKVRGALTSIFIMSDESAQQVARDFQRITLACLLAVGALVALQFRRPGIVLLVLLPPAFGMLLTAALFSLLGYRLNLMNLGVLPMLFGIGVDCCVYPVERWLARPEEGVAGAYRFTGGAVIVCVLTTQVSFGSLALSRNLGISSVGVLSFLGIGLCLLAAMVTLPAALQLSSRARRP